MVKERILLRKRERMYPFYPYESLIPDVDDGRDLGNSTREFKDLRIDGKAYVDMFGEAIQMSGGKHITVERDDSTDIGTTTAELRNVYVDGKLFVDAIGEDVQISGGKNITLERDNSNDIGASTLELKDVYIDGFLYADSIRVDNEIRLYTSGAAPAASGDGTFYIKWASSPILYAYVRSGNSAVRIWASKVLGKG